MWVCFVLSFFLEIKDIYLLKIISMKTFLSRLLIGIVGLTSMPAILIWADAGWTPGKIHHFTIIAPATAKVGEAIDVTVEAKDKDDKIIPTYRGSIYFNSDTDFGASVPAQGKAMQFKESDNGVLKTSKWTIFKRVGNQILTVNETREDAGGSLTIRIEDATSTTLPPQESITITTPEKGSVVTSDTVMMSGKTKKNSKVVIKLNVKEVGTTNSDENGIFTYKLTGISQQSNALNASVLDGANTIIGSIDTQFGFWVKAPTYYNTSILPGVEVETSTSTTFTVDAEPGLTEVSITLDGTNFITKEQSPGKYSVSTISPKTTGVYPITVNLKNILSQTTTKSDAISLTVKAPLIIAPPPAPKVAFKNVVLTSEWTRINMNFFIENLPGNTAKFKIAYGENAESFSNEVMTLPIEKIQRPDGSYNWYIDKLVPKMYSFKIFGVDASGSLLPEFVSETLSMTVGKAGCTIGNLSSVKVATSSDKTVLSWDALSGALSYNIYRLSTSKDYELVKNVTENSYTLFLSSGALLYQDFAVKALCDEKTESETPALASRVQTWPGLLTLLIIVSSLLGIFFIRRKVA